MTPEQWRERSYERNVADARKKRKRVEARNKKAIEERIQFERDYEEFSKLNSERLTSKIDNTVTLPLNFEMKCSLAADGLEKEAELISTWYRRRGWFAYQYKTYHGDYYIVKVFASRSGMIWNKIKEDLDDLIGFKIALTLILCGIPALFWILTFIDPVFMECSGREAVEVEKA